MPRQAIRAFVGLQLDSRDNGGPIYGAGQCVKEKYGVSQIAIVAKKTQHLKHMVTDVCVTRITCCMSSHLVGVNFRPHLCDTHYTNNIDPDLAS